MGTDAGKIDLSAGHIVMDSRYPQAKLNLYDDTELRTLIGELGEKEKLDVTELRELANLLEDRLSREEEKEDKDTVYDDTELKNTLQTILQKIQELEDKEDKDTVYDDTEVRNLLANLLVRIEAEESKDLALSGVADLTSVFKTGKSKDINAEIEKNKSKVIYVGPGTYNLDGTILLLSVPNFICMGTLQGPANVSKLKPMSEYWPGTLYRNDVVRALVCYCGSKGNIHISKIVVRHNYCAFYTYYSKASNITIDYICGVYSYTSADYRNEYKSVFGNGGKLGKAKRYKPISDEWHMNSGFMTDHLDSCTVNIGAIENLNHGIYFIETIPDKNPDPNKWSGINFGYIEIQCNTFNVNTIICKKAVHLNLDDAIEWSGENTVYTKKHALGGNNILGNTFNINSFVAGTGERTNSVEINHEWYYDQTKDNRRVMFELLGKSTDKGQDYICNNKFNVTYAAGVYDIVVRAVRVSSDTWNMYVQPNDVYFNDSTSHAQRNNLVTQYMRGTSSGYEDKVTITGGPLLIFDNCYNCVINNDRRAYFRPNEIDVKENCENIRINQVEGKNNGDYWHRILRSNFKNIKSVIYNGSDVYEKYCFDGFTKVVPEGYKTDQDIYECQWRIISYGSTPFTAEEFERKLNMYYEDWRKYIPNVELFNDITSHITEGYITGKHAIEKFMYQAVVSSGCDLDAEDKWGVEQYGECIVK